MKQEIPGQMGLFMPVAPQEWTRPEFLPDWTQHPLIAMDFETKDDGINSGRGAGWAFNDYGYICGMGICNGEKSLYFPVRHPDSDNFDVDAVHRWIKAHVKRPGGETIYHNAAYDTGWILREVGCTVDKVSDTMIMEVMINENRRSYSLSGLCKLNGIPGKDEGLLQDTARSMGVHPKKELWKIPARYVGPYGQQDPESTWNLYHLQKPEIEKQELEYAYRLECDLVEVCVQMRMRGIRIDQRRLETLRVEYITKRDRLLDQLSDEFGLGRKASIDDILSSKKLGAIFDNLGLTYPFTKTGLPSFESDWLEKQKHWISRSVALVKKYDQAADKFLTGYIEDSIVDGRLHAEIHQVMDRDEQTGYGGGTKSYRLSYSTPPLQQMPARDPDIGKAIREVFLPEEGDEWIVGDYVAQEPRIMIHYAGALQVRGWQAAVDFYNKDINADYHRFTASQVLDKSADQITKSERDSLKPINLGIPYGLGKKKLALNLGISLEEAIERLEIYHEKLPFVKALMWACENKVKSTGFIKLIDGARCRFDLWRQKEDWSGAGYSYETAKKKWPNELLVRADTHKSMNRLIQGSAARQTKKAMLDLYQAGFLPLLQMHDDLSFSGNASQIKQIGELMTNAIKLLIPVKVDLQIGPSWGKAKRYD